MPGFLGKLYFDDFEDWACAITECYYGKLPVKKIFAGIDKNGYWIRNIYNLNRN